MLSVVIEVQEMCHSTAYSNKLTWVHGGTSSALKNGASDNPKKYYGKCHAPARMLSEGNKFAPIYRISRVEINDSKPLL